MCFMAPPPCWPRALLAAALLAAALHAAACWPPALLAAACWPPPADHGVAPL
jgi:hypothetical protein